MKKNIAKISDPGQVKWKSILQFAAFLLTRPGFGLLKKTAKKTLYKSGLIKQNKVEYKEWIKAALDPAKLKKEYNDTIGSLARQPVISIILQAFNTEPPILQSVIDAVITQSYPHWQLYIVAHETAYSHPDKRIITLNTKEQDNKADILNTALASATDDIFFMSKEHLLTPNCLFEFARHTNMYPDDGIIYCDEDILNEQGEYSTPHFKPGWAPDNLLSGNYIGDAVLIKKGLISDAGGINTGYEPCYIYDLLLRVTELKTGIGHISKILYHKRNDQPAKKDASQCKKKILESAMARRNTPAVIDPLKNASGNYHIQYQLQSFDKVSIIIPTKDHTSLLKAAIDSIIEKTDYPDYEIIVLNNNSTTEEFHELMLGYKKSHSSKIKCIDAHFPFNYSKLMNLGASVSDGVYLLMLNNDVTVIHKDWMTQMVSYAQRKQTGAVGVKLLFPDNTIQHAGIVLGINGDAGHIFNHMPANYSGHFNYAQTTRNYSAVTGACMMCRKEVYNEVGGMDETLAVEYNDFDLCLKFIEHGYYNVYLPSVTLYHHESATRGHPFRNIRSYKQHEKDFTIFANKWSNTIKNDHYYNLNLSKESLYFTL